MGVGGPHIEGLSVATTHECAGHHGCDTQDREHLPVAMGALVSRLMEGGGPSPSLATHLASRGNVGKWGKGLGKKSSQFPFGVLAAHAHTEGKPRGFLGLQGGASRLGHGSGSS